MAHSAGLGTFQVLMYGAANHFGLCDVLRLGPFPKLVSQAGWKSDRDISGWCRAQQRSSARSANKPGDVETGLGLIDGLLQQLVSHRTAANRKGWALGGHRRDLGSPGQRRCAYSARINMRGRRRRRRPPGPPPPAGYRFGPDRGSTSSACLRPVRQDHHPRRALGSIHRSGSDTRTPGRRPPATCRLASPHRTSGPLCGRG
jgi:hypothetical protein